jgi:hypothetical protein
MGSGQLRWAVLSRDGDPADIELVPRAATLPGRSQLSLPPAR